jgi:hypothetical protein
MTIAHAQPHPANAWHGAVAGALLLLVLALLFWATAATQVLPADPPLYVRAFSPGYGIGGVVAGLACAALLGAIVGLLVMVLAQALARLTHRAAG